MGTGGRTHVFLDKDSWIMFRFGDRIFVIVSLRRIATLHKMPRKSTNEQHSSCKHIMIKHTHSSRACAVVLPFLVGGFYLVSSTNQMRAICKLRSRSELPYQILYQIRSCSTCVTQILRHLIRRAISTSISLLFSLFRLLRRSFSTPSHLSSSCTTYN